MKTVELILISNSERYQSQLLNIFAEREAVKVRHWLGGVRWISNDLSWMLHSFYYTPETNPLWELIMKRITGAIVVLEMTTHARWKDLLPLIHGWRNSLEIPISIGVENSINRSLMEIRRDLSVEGQVPIFTFQLNQPESMKKFWKDTSAHFVEYWKKRNSGSPAGVK